MISMKEIGRLCGVSESTVSKALRGNPAVKESTVQRVLEVARRYGYQPNAMVECIQTGRSRTIGIAYNNFKCQYAGMIMEGIQEVLYAADYTAHVMWWDRLVAENAAIWERFARRRVDGVILFPPLEQHSNAQLDTLRQSGVPVVMVDQRVPGYDFDYVGSDNRNAMKHLVMELCQRHGYSRIGALMFSGPSSAEERRQGLMDAVLSLGLAIAPGHYVELTNAAPEAVYAAAREILTSPQPPQLLVCFNDYFAREALNAAADCGVAVPEQVAVCGFGNLPLTWEMRPQLTTMDQSAVEMGATAARRLLVRIEGRQVAGLEAILPCREVLRHSTGD